MKVIVRFQLQKFVFSAEGNVEEVPVTRDIVIKPKDGTWQQRNSLTFSTRVFDPLHASDGPFSLRKTGVFLCNNKEFEIEVSFHLYGPRVIKGDALVRVSDTVSIGITTVRATSQVEGLRLEVTPTDKFPLQKLRTSVPLAWSFLFDDYNRHWETQYKIKIRHILPRGDYGYEIFYRMKKKKR